MAKKLLVIHLGESFYKRQKNLKLHADKKNESDGFQETFPYQFFSALLLLHRHDFIPLLIVPRPSQGSDVHAVEIKPALSTDFSLGLAEFLSVEQLPLFLFFTTFSQARALCNAFATKQEDQLPDEVRRLKAFAFDRDIKDSGVHFALVDEPNQETDQRSEVEADDAKLGNTAAEGKEKNKKVLLRRLPFNARADGGDAKEIECSGWLSLAETLAYDARIAVVKRDTSETKIAITLNLDGSGVADIHTGLNFYDHMLDNFTKHAGVDLTLRVDGDLHVDEHHTIEDTAIALGAAFDKALGNKRGIARYGFDLPMDEAAASCVLDLGGRAYLKYDIKLKREWVGDFPTEMLKHFYDSFAKAGRLNLHIAAKGDNDHHTIEASFKAMARSFRMALQKQGTAVPSTKGAL